MSLNLLNPFRFGIVPPPVVGEGVWTELGRTTLGVAGDVISVTGLPNKRYYMTLGHYIQSGVIRPNTSFNGDFASTNYAQRSETDGAADVSFASQAFWFYNNQADDQFFVSQFANRLEDEKLGIVMSCLNGGAGAANAPRRELMSAKWVNTVASINRIDSRNDTAGDFDIGSELVVLGWTPADTHNTSVNFWEDLASVTLASSGDTLSTGIFNTRKYLWIQTYLIDTGGVITGRIRVGNGTVDSGTNYAQRIAVNGAADGTNVSQARWQGSGVVSASPHFQNYFIVNRPTNEKLAIGHATVQNTAGGGTAPARSEWAQKWANTVNPINIIETFNDQAGSYDVGSRIRVWGHN